MKKISVLVVDEHPVVCEGIRMILASSRDVTLAGETTSGDAAVRALASRPADVVLLNLGPGERAVDIISRIVEVAPDTMVLVFTASHDPEQQRDALVAGARGIITMDKPCSVLLEAICKVASGELWFERRLLEAVVRRSVRSAQSRDALTERQAKIVSLIGEGLTNAEIAQRLLISEKTVRNHLTSIFDKFDVPDRLKLLVYASQNGLLSVSVKENAGGRRQDNCPESPGQLPQDRVRSRP
jgi:NarL family two-component system response regulator LiaR